MELRFRRADAAPSPALRVAAPTVAVLAGLFVLAAALTWWSMPAGPLSSNDSITYLGVARNIAEGRGITSPFAFDQTGLSPDEGAARLGAEPMTSWPPLYPLALAAGTPLGLSIESASRLLNVLACGATAVLTALLARRLGASVLTGALAGLAVVVNGAAALTFAAVATETLYLPLQLLALVALATAAARMDPSSLVADARGDPLPPPDAGAGRAGALAVFTAAASAAALTRHVGLALIATGVVVLAWRATGARRVRTALTIGALATTPPLLAVAWARSQPGWRSGPHFQNRLDELITPATSAYRWFVPGDGPVPGLLAVGLLVAMIVASVATGVAVMTADHRSPDAPTASASSPADTLWSPTLRTARERQAALVAVTVHTVTYLSIVTISGWWLDRNVPFLDWRIALPLLPPTMAVLAAGADAAVRRTAARSRPVGTALLATVAVPVLAVLAANALYSREHVWSRAVSGVWTPPASYATMRTVADLPDHVLVFANQPSAVFALSGRPLLTLPVRSSTMTGAPNPNAERDLDQLVALLSQRRAVVVLERAAVVFFALDGQPLVTEEQLRGRVPLTTIAEDERFVVLGCTCTAPPPPPAPRAALGRAP